MVVFRLVVGVLMCLIALGFGLYMAEIQTPMTQFLGLAVKLLAALGIGAAFLEYQGEIRNNGY